MSGNSVNHMYFMMYTDRNLLPKINSLNNSLQKEATRSGYSCGNIYMFISVKILGLKYPIDLCDQSIVTQHNFCNTKHFDSNLLSESETALVFNDTKFMKDP